MLDYLKEETNKTYTENGAVTFATTMSDCLDLFATIGAVRNASEEDIITGFTRAYAEDPVIATKILFYARDIRGGLGERRVFKTILRYLAEHEPDTVIRNIVNVAEYGRYDDLLVLIGTPCEKYLIAYYKETLEKDLDALDNKGEVSLLAKWLPSVNASNSETVKCAKKLARKMGYTDASYRKILSRLRSYIKIIENNLRTRDYSFEYEKQTSKSLLKYRQAFIKNDNERYEAFLEKAVSDPSVYNTGTLTPYDIVAPVVDRYERKKAFTKEERRSLDVTWNALENYVGCENALAVVDGSGSMYCYGNPLPAAVAESLGIYFAERNTGAFKGHFITFSHKPKLVKIKGRDIVEKMNYCMGYNECSNTNIAAVFNLILSTAVKNNMTQNDIPDSLYIISDMEFDWCAEDASVTNFENAKKSFEKHGYKLPRLVFWNVCSRNRQQPVTMNDEGVILVSGCTPQIFSMITNDRIDPYQFMMSVITSKRYERIA